MSNSIWKKLTIITGVTALVISFASIFILGENTPEGFMVVDADPVLLTIIITITSMLFLICFLGIMRSMMGNKLTWKTVIYTILTITVIIIGLEISHFLRETERVYNMVTNR